MAGVGSYRVQLDLESVCCHRPAMTSSVGAMIQARARGPQSGVSGTSLFLREAWVLPKGWSCLFTLAWEGTIRGMRWDYG